MSNPVISIIIPVYNAENFIEHCVNSVLKQSYKAFELILVDDGSTDNSFSICVDFAKKDERIIVIRKNNGGAASARNMGLDWVFENSDSEWIAFIDSDDTVDSHYLDYLYNAVIKSDAQISLCAYKSVLSISQTDNEQLLSFYNKDTEECYCDDLGIVVPFAKLFHISLWRDIRYPEGIIYEDEFTIYKVLFQVSRIAVVDNTLYYYYLSQDSVMRSVWSEKNLVLVSAREEQLSYYKEHGLSRIYSTIAKVYIFDLSEILTSKLIFLPQKLQKKYGKVLRKKLRIALLKYRSVYRFNWKSWTLLAAYPLYEKLLMKFHFI